MTKSVTVWPPMTSGGMSLARMPSAPFVTSFQLRATSRKTSATAIEARTKYGPRRRKVIDPTTSAATTASATAGQTPHQGATCSYCMSIRVA